MNNQLRSGSGVASAGLPPRCSAYPQGFAARAAARRQGRGYNPASGVVAGALLAMMVLITAVAARAGEAPTLPFSVALKEPFSIEGMPGLHSYAYAHADIDGTKWVLLSGRKNGLHGFLGYFDEEKNRLAENFPVDQAADRVWVVDVERRKTWSAPLDGLPTELAEPLRSTNAQGVQVGDRLYIAGGYGFSAAATATGKFITFDTLTTVDVTGLARAVMAGKPIVPYFEQTTHPGMKVTGGYMDVVGDRFYLVFGNSFDGLYTPNPNAAGETFQQRYTEEVRTFAVRHDPLRIVDYRAYPREPLDNPTRPYHRRDGNMGPAISPDGKPCLGVYGGVFRPGQFEAYFEPIYIEDDGRGDVKLTIDRSFEQVLNQYECPLLPVHDARSGTMYTAFFGGMSSFWYNPATGDLVKDAVGIVDGNFIDGVPFIKTAMVMVRGKDGKTDDFILPIAIPGYLGASGHFLVDPRVPKHENGVIRLEALSGPTTVGYIFGGIESSGPYGTGHKSNNRTWAYGKFIPVVVTPGPWAVKPVPRPKDKSEIAGQGSASAPVK